MRDLRRMPARLLLIATLLVIAVSGVEADDVARITPEELKTAMTSGDIVVIDVRGGWDWNASTEMISGAVREEPADVEKWAAKYAPDKTIVLYCT